MRKLQCDELFRRASLDGSPTTLSKCFDVQPSLAERIDLISTSIESIREIVPGKTRESFIDDLVARLAVERLLEIISEASRFIPSALKEKELSISWPTGRSRQLVSSCLSSD